jgi:hypothetical protein
MYIHTYIHTLYVCIGVNPSGVSVHIDVSPESQPVSPYSPIEFTKRRQAFELNFKAPSILGGFCSPKALIHPYPIILNPDILKQHPDTYADLLNPDIQHLYPDINSPYPDISNPNLSPIENHNVRKNVKSVSQNVSDVFHAEGWLKIRSEARKIGGNDHRGTSS